MLTERKNHRAKGHGNVEHPTLAADAATLGCTPSHLWRCLKQRRLSPTLLKKYRALKALDAEIADLAAQPKTPIV